MASALLPDVSGSAAPAQGEAGEAARGDAPPALDELFRRYSGYVAAIGLRLLGRPDEVDDLVQDVFLAAHRGLAGLRAAEAVKGWLAAVTVRLARRRLRMRRLRGFVGLDDGPGRSALELADGSASPEQRALLARVYRVLDELPVALRLAWTLRQVEGEPLDSVATLCGCSLATAKRRITEAQRRIHEATR